MEVSLDDMELSDGSDDESLIFSCDPELIDFLYKGKRNTPTKDNTEFNLDSKFNVSDSLDNEAISHAVFSDLPMHRKIIRSPSTSQISSITSDSSISHISKESTAMSDTSFDSKHCDSDYSNSSVVQTNIDIVKKSHPRDRFIRPLMGEMNEKLLNIIENKKLRKLRQLNKFMLKNTLKNFPCINSSKIKRDPKHVNSLEYETVIKNKDYIQCKRDICQIKEFKIAGNLKESPSSNLRKNKQLYDVDTYFSSNKSLCEGCIPSTEKMLNHPPLFKNSLTSIGKSEELKSHKISLDENVNLKYEMSDSTSEELNTTESDEILTENNLNLNILKYGKFGSISNNYLPTRKSEIESDLRMTKLTNGLNLLIANDVSENVKLNDLNAIKKIHCHNKGYFNVKSNELHSLTTNTDINDILRNPRADIYSCHFYRLKCHKIFSDIHVTKRKSFSTNMNGTEGEYKMESLQINNTSEKIKDVNTCIEGKQIIKRSNFCNPEDIMHNSVCDILKENLAELKQEPVYSSVIEQKEPAFGVATSGRNEPTTEHFLKYADINNYSPNKKIVIRNNIDINNDDEGMSSSKEKKTNHDNFFTVGDKLENLPSNANTSIEKCNNLDTYNQSNSSLHNKESCQNSRQSEKSTRLGYLVEKRGKARNECVYKTENKNTKLKSINKNGGNVVKNLNSNTGKPKHECKFKTENKNISFKSMQNKSSGNDEKSKSQNKKSFFNNNKRPFSEQSERKDCIKMDDGKEIASLTYLTQTENNSLSDHTKDGTSAENKMGSNCLYVKESEIKHAKDKSLFKQLTVNKLDFTKNDRKINNVLHGKQCNSSPIGIQELDIKTECIDLKIIKNVSGNSENEQGPKKLQEFDLWGAFASSNPEKNKISNHLKEKSKKKIINNMIYSKSDNRGDDVNKINSTTSDRTSLNVKNEDTSIGNTRINEKLLNTKRKRKVKCSKQLSNKKSKLYKYSPPLFNEGSPILYEDVPVKKEKIPYDEIENNNSKDITNYFQTPIISMQQVDMVYPENITNISDIKSENIPTEISSACNIQTVGDNSLIFSQTPLKSTMENLYSSEEEYTREGTYPSEGLAFENKGDISSFLLEFTEKMLIIYNYQFNSNNVYKIFLRFCRKSGIKGITYIPEKNPPLHVWDTNMRQTLMKIFEEECRHCEEHILKDNDIKTFLINLQYHITQ